MKKSRTGLTVIIIVLLVLIAGVGGLVGFITDFMWFRELGYTAVFLKKLITELTIGVPVFVVLTVIGYIHLQVLKRGYLKKINTAEPAVKPKTLGRIALGLSAAAAVVVTFLSVTQLWFEYLKFSNSTDFGVADPIFNMDVSFYVFKLRFITELNESVITVVIALVILTLIYYSLLLSLCKPKAFEPRPVPSANEADEEEYYSPGDGGGYGGDMITILLRRLAETFVTGRRRPAKPAPARSGFGESNMRELLNIAAGRISVLGVIFFLMVGVNMFLRQYDLLYSTTGVLYGAGFTDINVTLLMYRVLIVLSVVAAVFFAVGVRQRRYRTVLAVPALMIAVGLVGTGAGAVVQSLVVSPDEITKESPYLAYNISFTQSAYDLGEVQTKPFAADNNLTADDIRNNESTLANIRINDYEPAKQFYNQTQTIRPYYSFSGVDVDRYTVNGEYTQTFLSAREVDEGLINQEWINKYLKYTHGYGITLSRVDKVTASGQPDMMIRDIPPVSSVSEIGIDRPEIYFGELTDNYVMVNTDEPEYDYPDGDENAWTFYEGTAGIPLNLINRSLFALREQNLQLLVSTNINADSKIVINRNIATRVREIMPYLSYDPDPYIVAVDGKLYWIIDAYTVSSQYPYSEPYRPDESRVNYVRNSVKVVIDAYNGDVSYYLVDDNDPVANTFMNIYPTLFRPFGDMPDALRRHIRYPARLLDIQANVYKRYHVNDVRVFYQGEDQWDISQEALGSGDPVSMSPQYYIMKLPGEKDVEFINSIPYVPKNKKNMTGLLVARNDGEHYGELILYQLPKSKVVYGPMQIEAQIDQNDAIAKEFSLWKNSGSNYTRGNMFVIPIEQSLVYVEPVYLAAANSSLPEVRRVIVAYGDRIAYESTLGAALDSMFGAGASDGIGSSGESGGDTDDAGALSVDELILRANEAYRAATDAQRAGDWAAYGKQLKQLENYLNALAPQPEETAGEVTGEDAE